MLKNTVKEKILGAVWLDDCELYMKTVKGAHWSNVDKLQTYVSTYKGMLD